LANYERQILHILMQVGERGISVAALSKHVYNMNCTLFFQPDVQEVKQYVRQYLLRNAKSKQALVESTGRRGWYRLNTQHSADVQQLILHFRETVLTADEEKMEEDTTQKDYSLDLFADDAF